MESPIVMLGEVAGAVFAQGRPNSAMADAKSDYGWMISVGLLVIVGVWVYVDHRRKKQINELRMEQAKANRLMEQNAEREQRAYAQHVALNDLAAQKMKLEIEHLQMQARLGQMEVESRERADEYHRLMSEKTRFEIQSLKLHIREQNKRLDDFGGYNDE
jgi:methylmalonyl-CoA mutase N-terminal domain/subunit